MKRIGLLKAAPGVQGKILEAPSGKRTLIVEQKGKDVWRGRHRSIHEAIEANDAGIGVDRILLQMAQRHNVSVVLVVIEEQCRIYVAPIDTYFADGVRNDAHELARSRTRVLGFRYLMKKFLGPNLSSRRKRATA